MRPLLDKTTLRPAEWRDEIPIESEIGRCVVTERYKYARFDSDGEEEEQLVDLQNDPGEMTNLAGRHGYAQVLAECRERWARMFEKT